MGAHAIGEQVAADFIGKLADQVFSYISKQVEYQKGVKEKLKKLEANLRKIHATIQVAEKCYIPDRSLLAWLRELKDAAYAAEDVLDSFEYQILEEMVKDQVSTTPLFTLQSQSKSTDFLQARNYYASTFIKRLFFCDEDLNELYEVVQRFDDIISDIGNFQSLVQIHGGVRKEAEVSDIDIEGEALDWRDTTSMPGVLEILGREHEIDDLVNFLRNDAYSSIKDKFSMVSIVGIGGVGKTSLAQYVYNDSRIDVLFDVKVWVCVRQKFNIKRITRQILESVSSYCHHHQLTNLDKMQATLKARLMNQRFLIVLDDVWNEVRSLWEMLRKPFNFGKNGSRVLVTTRINKVAKMMEAKATILLEGLNDQDYAKFFDYCAFGDANPKEHPKLQLIGRRIAKKLAGSPLAAKTVGSLLKCYLEEEHWRNIMESKLWQVEQQPDDIFPALKLSYEHLSTSNLKQCFVYFSLFPKDYHFDKDRLIRIWMAQGFLQPNNSRKRMEDIGREYFDELVHRSFLQEADNVRPKKYVIHDLIHELAESLSADEYCRLEDDGSVAIPQRVRHMYINSSTLSTVNENVSKLINLRTLVIKGSLIVNVSKSNLTTLMENILKQFKFLRALILEDLPLEVTPDSIGYLIHLRYLEIIGICSALTETLCKLYHLQGLELQFHVLPSHARIVPAGMHKLVNMRYLNAKPGKVSTSISSIGNLSFLQELKEFYVRKETGFDLRQLSNLRQLRGQLSIMNLEMAIDGRDAKLENKEHLSTVHLCWGQDGNPKHHEEVLEALRPHPNLAELRIIGYMGTKNPSWLNESWLSNLERIELEACSRLEILPPMGQLPFLRRLHLKSLELVKEIDTTFYGQNTAFPLLEELLFSDMQEWMRWLRVPSNLRVFSCLQKLSIDGCSKLQGPLVLPSLLKKLHIVLSDDITWELSSDQLNDAHSVLSEDNTSSTLKLCIDNIFVLVQSLQLECFSLVYRMDIVFCQSLVSFTDEQEEWFKKLISLKKVSFINCDKLVALPKDLKNRASLEILHVENCPKIKW